MQKKTKVLLGSGIAALIVASATLATPTLGTLVNKLLAVGTVDEDINAHAHVFLPSMEEDFNVSLSTEGASNIIQQEITFLPGGTTGWHKHPGLVILTLAPDSGPVDWYDAHCGKRVYKAGDSWTEGNKLHDVVNRGRGDVHFFVTYIVAQTPDLIKRTDEPAPRCANQLGLE